MKGKTLYTTMLLAWLLAACSLITDYTLGDLAEKRIELPAYIDKFDVKGSFNITILQDSIGFIVIKCHEKVMADVEVSYRNNTVFLSEKVKDRWLKDYPIVEVEMHIASVNMIETHQPCRLYIPGPYKVHSFYLVDWGNYVDCDVNVDVDLFRIDVSGESFGTYRARGQAEYSTINALGVALFDLLLLQVKYCNVTQGSSVSMGIWVTDFLKVNIVSSGNVNLRGNPAIELNSQGTGMIIQSP